VTFNSIEFAIFLPIVFVLYWFVSYKNKRIQNLILLVSSYFFYGWWDWRFLLLIAFSSCVDYTVGIVINGTKKESNRKLLLATSIVTNIGLLAFFKYFNFFAQNFQKAFTFFGCPITDPMVFDIILPVGISFYTFQTLSYTIDIYRGKLQPTRDMIAFFAFVSFFPQLVAGPIERATHLLTQFHQNKTFIYGQAVDGMRQILWGLFKKIVIADNCAIFVNDIFACYHTYSGSTLLIGAMLFAFQIYGDFSGYSDIAIGTSRLFGYHLKRNFNFPYFSRDIAEFWRRWHISLSTWFRDYVYIPLGGSRCTNIVLVRNVFIIFIVSGFWHGANWTFIAWGTIHAIYILPYLLLKTHRKHTNTVAENAWLPNFTEIWQMGITFLLVSIAWVFFRSESITKAFIYISEIFSASLFSPAEVFPKRFLLLIFLFVCVEWFQRKRQHALEFCQIKMPLWTRWGIYYVVIFMIWQLGAEQQEFIYFQF
jgi:D-alanyl-lipoteichoic acid acyltransferase DltB (MBOAT superfamily)